jgi:hypothetical protein
VMSAKETRTRSAGTPEVVVAEIAEAAYLRSRCGTDPQPATR